MVSYKNSRDREISFHEMQFYLNISRDTAYHLVNDKSFFPAHKTGKSWMVSMGSLKKWIHQQIKKRFQ